MSKATELRALASHARFAVIVSAALVAACGGSATVSDSAPNTPAAGASGSTSSIALAAAGSPAARAGSAGSSTTSSAVVGQAGSGAAAMSVPAGSAGSNGSAARPTFSAVYNALFSNTAAPGCFGCHSGMANPALNGNFAMVTDKAVAFRSLVGAMSSEAGMCKGMTRVSPGDPMSSLLYLKLSGSPCGMMMPPGGTVPAETLTLVKDWIMAGAQND